MVIKKLLNIISMGAKKAVIKQIVRQASNSSDSNLIRLTYLAEKLAKQKEKPKIAKIREYIQEGHPAVKFIRRVLNDYDPHCTKKLIENLIIKGVLVNNQKREERVKKGEAGLFTVLISPTMRCNLNCKGCYANQYSKGDDLSFKVIDRIVKEAKEMGVALVTILGGEPFIRPDLFELFKKHNDIYFQVYTNGTLINENLCKKLKKVGNVFPQISIEGFEKETDERRGKGVYKGVMKAMDLLKNHKIPYGYSVCATSKNVKKIMSDKFMNMMINKGALVGWYFLFMPVCGKPDMKLMPSPEQRLFMLDRGMEIRRTKPIFIVDFWNDAPFVGGCIAGSKYAHITSNGDVEPCIFTHFATDNIKDKSLSKCVNSPYFKALRSKQPYNDNLYLPCQWIDNPEVSRELHKKFKLRPTHAGADDILKQAKLKKQIDAYSKKVKKVYEKAWKERGKEIKESDFVSK